MEKDRERERDWYIMLSTICDICIVDEKVIKKELVLNSPSNIYVYNSQQKIRMIRSIFYFIFSLRQKNNYKENLFKYS